jgi:hypothetical protein
MCMEMIAGKYDNRAYPPTIKNHSHLPTNRRKKEQKRDLNPLMKKLEQQQGMTNATPLGKLFVSLIPTERELQLCSSCLQYQQIIVFNVIKEFGFDTIAIVQLTPQILREISRGISIFPRVHNPGPSEGLATPAFLAPLSGCMSLGYLILQGVPQQPSCMVEREYCYRWQQASDLVARYTANISHTRTKNDGPGDN